MVVPLVVGLVIGAAGVGAGWALGGDGGTPAPGSGPAGDAHAACQVLDGFDESAYAAKGAEGDVARNRLAAAQVLSASAAAGSATYKPLADAVRDSVDRYARLFEFDAKARQDLAEARRICGTL